MDEGNALVLLETMVAASTEPTLTDDELLSLIALARRPDTSGALPSDTEWIPTWNLAAGAAEGWRWKAGKASAHFDFSTDNQSFERSQIWEHCMQQAAWFDEAALLGPPAEVIAANRGIGSIPTHRYDVEPWDLIGNVNDG